MSAVTLAEEKGTLSHAALADIINAVNMVPDDEPVTVAEKSAVVHPKRSHPSPDEKEKIDSAEGKKADDVSSGDADEKEEKPTHDILDDLIASVTKMTGDKGRGQRKKAAQKRKSAAASAEMERIKEIAAQVLRASGGSESKDLLKDKTLEGIIRDFSKSSSAAGEQDISALIEKLTKAVAKDAPSTPAEAPPAGASSYGIILYPGKDWVTISPCDEDQLTRHLGRILRRETNNYIVSQLKDKRELKIFSCKVGVAGSTRIPSLSTRPIGMEKRNPTGSIAVMRPMNGPLIITSKDPITYAEFGEAACKAIGDLVKNPEGLKKLRNNPALIKLILESEFIAELGGLKEMLSRMGKGGKGGKVKIMRG